MRICRGIAKNFLEFLAANVNKNVWMNQEVRLKSAFRIFDVQNNGKVTIVEMKAVFGSFLFMDKILF